MLNLDGPLKSYVQQNLMFNHVLIVGMEGVGVSGVAFNKVEIFISSVGSLYWPWQ